jgi:carboxyl-terminal processing protease
MFDKYKAKLSQIDDFHALEQYLESISIEDQFVKYAANVDKIIPAPGEWEESREYMMPQVKGLVGRFSKLGEEAFYRFYLPLDDAIQAALQGE